MSLHGHRTDFRKLEDTVKKLVWKSGTTSVSTDCEGKWLIPEDRIMDKKPRDHSVHEQATMKKVAEVTAGPLNLSLQVLNKST
jgi:hypothetical protein